MGMSGSSSLSKKQRKARTAFTDHQLQTLEKSFERQKYLSVQDRMELANKLGLSDTQVNNHTHFCSLFRICHFNLNYFLLSIHRSKPGTKIEGNYTHFFNINY